jgi:hypothetical protein
VSIVIVIIHCFGCCCEARGRAEVLLLRPMLKLSSIDEPISCSVSFITDGRRSVVCVRTSYKNYDPYDYVKKSKHQTVRVHLKLIILAIYNIYIELKH